MRINSPNISAPCAEHRQKACRAAVGYPALGEHTRAALSEAGFTAAEIDTLYAVGVVAGC